MGRSRGGLTTKIHCVVDARGLPLSFHLTPGQAADCPAATHLLGHLGHKDILLADKAYDADWLRRKIEDCGGVPNIHNKANREASISSADLTHLLGLGFSLCASINAVISVSTSVTVRLAPRALFGRTRSITDHSKSLHS